MFACASCDLHELPRRKPFNRDVITMARIAVCGIDTESSNFSPLPTVLDDFEVLRGQELPAAGRY